MHDWQRRHRSVCHNLSNDKARELPAKESPVVVPNAKVEEPHAKEPQVLQTQTWREVDLPQNVKREAGRDNSVNNNDRPNRYQHQQPNQKVNRNQHFKGYNNLRRPKVLSENQNAQNEEEESFENDEIKLPQHIAPKPEPERKPKPKPVNQEPEKPKNHEPEIPKNQEPEYPKNLEPKPQNQLKMLTKVPTVAEVTPVKKMVPKNYLVETLPVGDTFILTVDTVTESGVTCISLHPSAASHYDRLCEQFGVHCELEEPYTPQLGELFAYLNAADAAWYRARRISANTVVLIDAALNAALPARCCRVPAEYMNIPEFSCLMKADGLKIGDNLKCTIKSKSVDKCIVSIENVATGSVLGDGEVSRWRPKIEGVDSPVIPEVKRPDIENNMKVYLVDCTKTDKIYLRPSDKESCREFDAIQEDVVLYAKDADTIKENPQKGQTVIAKFTDGLWYRALCKRTNHSQNKYQLEYIEYGNIETQSRDAIYVCPPSLISRPTSVICARLKEPATTVLDDKATDATTMSEGAIRYLQDLRDRSVELILTLANGSSNSPSGAEVILQIAKNRESVNEKVLELNTPEWKKLEMEGADVIETPKLMITDIKYISVPGAACTLDVFVDLAALSAGAVSARPRGAWEDRLQALTGRMAKYCESELGKEPYLPAHEELCIALCPPYPQWFRAVLCDQVGGPGGSQVRVCYLDYGNLETIPVASVRKMLPEFIKELPALSLHVNIRGFPQNPTNDILAKAVSYMRTDEEGRGVLNVTNCKEIGFGMYDADAPGLIDALK